MEEESTVTSEEENSITTTEDDTVFIERENTISNETCQEDTVSSECDFSSVMNTQHGAIMDIIDKTLTCGKYQYITDSGKGEFGTVIKVYVMKMPSERTTPCSVVEDSEHWLGELLICQSITAPDVLVP